MVEPKITKGSKRVAKLKYKKEFADQFYAYCEQGLLLTTIAYKMGIPKKYFLRWAKDPKRWEFMRAFERGKEACQAYHEQLLDDMISGRIPRCDAASKQLQRDRLRIHFKEDWSDNKQEIKIESSLEKMSTKELQKELENLIVKPANRKFFKDTIEHSSEPKFKIVGKPDSAKEK